MICWTVEYDVTSGGLVHDSQNFRVTEGLTKGPTERWVGNGRRG